MDNLIKALIGKVADGADLTRQEARAAMGEIMDGNATPSQIAALITSLRMKGETVEEITGFAEAMRKKAAAIKLRRPRKGGVDQFGSAIFPGVIADTCGTGGDGTHTFNISTAAAFVVAGAGVTVAKHGNRSISSQCGSADVMRALGVNIDLTPDQARTCIEKVGVGFLFAPVFHSAMKHAGPTRAEIGLRTVFNLLGPLTNPAGANAQLVGVYKASLTEPVAQVLGNLGCYGALVVHGEGGYDEITITGSTKVSRLLNGKVRNFTIKPEDFGMARAGRDAVKGRDAQFNALVISGVLQGRRGAARDVVVLNAAGTLVAAGAAKNFKQGVKMAVDSIETGAAARKLELLVEESCGFKPLSGKR